MSSVSHKYKGEKMTLREFVEILGKENKSFKRYVYRDYDIIFTVENGDK